jgi:rhamnulokinase
MRASPPHSCGDQESRVVTGTIRVAAVDLGASSGRVVLGAAGRGVLRVETVARFPNEPVQLPDGLHWNVVELYQRVLDGIAAAARQASGLLAGMAIDSWAVDYGLLGDGRLLGLPFHYRDERNPGGMAAVHGVSPHAALYARNGLQLLPFNTLYQLAADPRASDADELLMIPDLLGYWLTGRSVTERTNASTTGLLNVHTGEWDDELVGQLGLPRRLLGRLVDPGEVVGRVLPHVGELIGVPDLELTTVGSHDTGSAIVGVPMQADDAAYISCGTWGLVGVELDKPVLTEASREANFTNERGVDGRIRFLTNVMGLWLLSETQRTWERSGHAESLGQLLAAAADVPATEHTFDVRDPTFLAPGHIPARIRRWYEDAGLRPPASHPELVRAIVDSLAQAFADALDQAEQLAGHPVRVVHLVGGGALNTLLCQATANRSGRPVLAGPVEATAIGNVLVQARTAGALTGDLHALRRLITHTTALVPYAPERASTTTGR